MKDLIAKWRQKIGEVGGLDNDLVSLPSGGVLKMLAEIEAEGERMRQALIAARSEIGWWVVEHRCCGGHEADAIAAIDAVLN